MGDPSPSPQAILHLISLHHLAQAGFASTSQAASLTLGSTLEHYLLLVARSSAERASIAGRSKVGVRDLARTLEELGVGGAEEVHEFAVGLGKQVEFVGLGGELRDHVKEGLERDIDEIGLADLKLKRDEDVPDGWWDEEDEEEMDVDDDVGERIRRISPIRPKSPDMTWLPPLPGVRVSQQAPQATPLNIEPGESELQPAASIPASTQSIADRYLHPIPYASSQHSQSHTFRHPPSTPYPEINLSEPPSSFPSLIETYKTTSGDASVSSRLTPLRANALEILRHQTDTIISTTSLIPPTSMPQPRSTPYVPTHSETLPTHNISLNPQPHPSSVLNPLLHTIESRQLPPSLRERLTHIRPPQPQNRESEPLFYGEPIRGPDDAALAKARGKVGEGQEGWVRATWDSGPKGAEKWGKGQLPTGRKVVQWGKGEVEPRRPEGSGGGVGKLKLKLGGSSPGGAPGGAEGGLSPGSGIAVMNGATATLSPGALPGGGIKLRLGALRRESGDGGPTHAPDTQTPTSSQEALPPMITDAMLVEEVNGYGDHGPGHAAESTNNPTPFGALNGYQDNMPEPNGVDTAMREVQSVSSVGLQGVSKLVFRTKSVIPAREV
jgi:hypothetical protein